MSLFSKISNITGFKFKITFDLIICIILILAFPFKELFLPKDLRETFFSYFLTFAGIPLDLWVWIFLGIFLLGYIIYLYLFLVKKINLAEFPMFVDLSKNFFIFFAEMLMRFLILSFAIIVFFVIFIFWGFFPNLLWFLLPWFEGTNSAYFIGVLFFLFSYLCDIFEVFENWRTRLKEKFLPGIVKFGSEISILRREK